MKKIIFYHLIIFIISLILGVVHFWNDAYDMIYCIASLLISIIGIYFTTDYLFTKKNKKNNLYFLILYNFFQILSFSVSGFTFRISYGPILNFSLKKYEVDLIFQEDFRIFTAQFYINYQEYLEIFYFGINLIALFFFGYFVLYIKKNNLFKQRVQ